MKESTIARIRTIWQTFDMALNIPAIDKQHIWLIGMIVELEDDLEFADPVSMENNFTRTLTRALDYTIEHFSLEEKVLESINYQKLGQHRIQHTRFIAVLRRRARERVTGDYKKAALNLLRNLRTWLFQHILSEDRAYLDVVHMHYDEIKDWMDSQFVNSPHSDEVEDLYRQVMNSSDTSKEFEFQTIGEDNLRIISELWFRYKLKTGIAIVDMQHLWLLQLLVRTEKLHRQRLKQEIKNEVLTSRIKEALTATIDYIKEHFSTEEAIMRRFSFHNTNSHIKQHRDFNGIINDLILRSRNDDTDAISKLLQDLKEWLISHIAVEDKKLFYFFRSRLGEVNEYVRELNQQGKIHIWKDAVSIYRLLVEYEETPTLKA
ncbi:hemerythrin-like metal-binding domain protein [Leptospira broomii serovar Hurstbridge str. 5399]|uniref:Hemerythrin-like metal-binding domain protein n=1 Tax=Leptospira broomii serovar Hurstbridge str. 5399 TaxID=1049789 RepID=T0GF79_9LEPT|nr:hemerythrin family protein [Leptospira broomii]EQA45484.1 hemerythrin-like metal-binding domain protein [Leptospira broomii serovar Hurstbridge str. 5399]